MNHRHATWLVIAALHAAAGRDAAAQAAPAVGQGYIVDGRCVTLTQVDGDQVSYEWREGNAYGNGYGPPDILGSRCRAGAAPPPAAPARPPANRPPAQRPPESHGAQPGRSQPMPPAAAPTGDFAREALQAHNRLRCLHGMPALQWSPEVAAYAQRWVDNHPYGHSDSYESPVGQLGENIASGYDTVADAAAAWYSEGKGYDFGRVRQGRMTGHFTAMMWKGVRYVGCGRHGDFISCNYFAGPDPAQCAIPNFNMDSCAKSQVLPPARSAAACP